LSFSLSPAQVSDLYRRLFSLVEGQRDETEIITFAVDALGDAMPNHRISYSQLSRSGDLVLRYARNVPGIPDMAGFTINLTRAPVFLSSLFRKELIQVTDIGRSELDREINACSPVFGISGARIYCPYEEDEGVLSLLTVTRANPGSWDAHVVQTVNEVGKLMHLFCRDSRGRLRLSRNEIIFRQFSEYLPLVLWMVDPRTREVQYINDAFENIWGFPKEKLYREPIAFLHAIHPEDQPMMLARMTPHRSGGFMDEYRVVRPDGTIRWVKDSSYPIFNSAGETERVVGIVEDITQLKEAKAQLEESQAQVVANAKFAALGEMASGIAHEINNPLAVIQGLASQVREQLDHSGKGNAVITDQLQTIEKMATRISSIIKGLRTFSRQTDWDPITVGDVSSIVDETLAIFSSRLHSSGVQLEVKLPAVSMRVRCRASEVCQVLVNLLNNAFDATELNFDRKIELSAEARENLVRIIVADNGPGVPAELSEKIFQPFFTTKEVGKGTGLGLSISKRLVESLGGRLIYERREDATWFIVELAREP
jgi:PAS domain S-box-containing protein